MCKDIFAQQKLAGLIIRNVRKSDTEMSIDLDNPKAIERFVELFYARLLEDEQLGPIFVDIAQIDIREHFPRIRAYWEKLLLGTDSYHRHTMNLHRAVHRKQSLTAADFERWLSYFVASVDSEFEGEYAERAKRIATQIAFNMSKSLDVKDG